jgi:hypothetical protein
VNVTTTDSNGKFRFANTSMPPGVYTVVETNPPGYVDVIDSDGGNPNVITVNVTTADNGRDPNVIVVDVTTSSEWTTTLSTRDLVNRRP